MNMNKKIELFQERILRNEIDNFKWLVDNCAEEQAIQLQGQVLKRLLKQMNNFYVETYCNDEL